VPEGEAGCAGNCFLPPQQLPPLPGFHVALFAGCHRTDRE
jgi:hypothetical protein